ncbi:MAG TPA: ribonuclease III domain-containing protein [Erysipelotrichaceae bacterium]|nr:ribonuclease III domain-containing protein [Erysipelotrichaceae bacterium]
MNPELLNGSTLAFVGDAILSLYVRDYLVKLGITKTKELQERSIKFVSANAQAKFIQKLLADNFLSEHEVKLFLRGRNHKSDTKAKNADIVTYRQSTGFEALLGYLYLTDNHVRLLQIWEEMKNTIDKEPIGE